ncbi:MAG: helicase-exonuclease AddAB subunit AddA [Peptococcaceae bacterium]|nr:helicase-exonuclease AddAB subunit AddA [Peptococcaceae bacterium]
MTEWTAAQEAAITGRDAHILVAAAAGAGKTAVLVERIIRRITDPADPVEVDQLLVVTFTNLAAAQMRQRIGTALAAADRPSPRTGSPDRGAGRGEKTRRQLLLLNMAAINTLHSFCLDLVRSHYYRLGLTPGFRVAGEDEADLIRRHVLENLMEKCYEAADPDFLALVDDYGGEKGDDRLVELVRRLYDFSRSHPDPEAWLAGAAGAFGGDAAFDDSAWSGAVRESILVTLAGARDFLVQAARLAGSPLGPSVYAGVLARDLDSLATLRENLARPWAVWRAHFRALAWARLPVCRGEGVDEEVKERVRYLRDKAKEALREVHTRYFAREPGELAGDHAKVAPRMAALVGLVSAFAAGYREAKLARGLVDFGDLEHFALRLLRGPDGAPSELALTLRHRYAEVMVDEYQDINAVQEAILQLVSRPANLFMVGDVKQSIYRFRLAEPGLFLEKYRRFAPEGPRRRVDLPENFRSRSEVIRAVNFLFRQIMTPVAGEMAYGPKEELACGLDYPGRTGPVELYLLEPGDDQPEDVLEREARLVAGRIRELLADGARVWEDGRFRPLGLRDIVVLLRSVRGAADSFVREFRRQGIPALATAGSGNDAAMEVATMLSLLQVIDNPRQDIPLAAVLRSPLVGIDAAGLAKIRAAGGEADFHRAAATLSGETRLDGFFSRLESWRAQAREGRLSDLIWRIYRETGFYDYAGAMPGGGARQANLRALYDRACQYGETSLSGLFDFLRFVENRREGGRDEPAGADTIEAVRVMSIHKSKGLEFPVVFLAGLGRSFNLQDARAQTVLHKDLGIGPDVVDRELGVRYPSWAKLAIRERLVRESLAEEMRVLYVALTRAREKLVLVGSVRNLAARVKEWSTYRDWPRVTLPEGRLLAAANCLDWIGPAVLRHRDGAFLGGGGEAPAEVRDDPSSWAVRCPVELSVPDRESAPVDEALFEQVRRGEPLAVSPALAAAVEAGLDWVYPYQAGLPAKIGVTELKRPFEPRDENTVYRYHPPARPRFLQETGELSELERGSAWHLVLQHVDLAGDLSAPGIGEQMRVMEENLLLTPGQAAVVDPGRLAGFFAGALGRRLTRGNVRRELPFSLLLPADEVYPAGRGETVLVQGVIDCLVEEEEGFLLVDWKTERLRGGAVERYRVQLDVYARAVRTILGRPVREKYLYFLLAEEAVLLP